MADAVHENPWRLENFWSRNEETKRLLKLLDAEHLRVELKPIASAIRDTAYLMVTALPDGPELHFGLRQLILAKDAFVRARVEELKL